jgi:L-ascorbate metabolism protein UlaG (beta-lactamase superfamily)
MKSFALALLFCLSFASSTAASCRDLDVTQRGSLAYAAEADAVIQYFGHNFFQITTSKGTKIVTDPLAPGMYPTPDLWPNVVTVGREHPNHNYVELAHGNPIVLRGLKNFGAEWNSVSVNVKDVFIYNLPIYQQAFGTALKGAAFIFDTGALCIAHLGDLSHTLTPEQLKQIGRIDVAMIPIGGVFTMPPDTAREVLAQIKPKIAIPMHYRDSAYILDAFIQGLAARRLDGGTLAVSKAALPKETQIVVMKPKGSFGGWGG